MKTDRRILDESPGVAARLIALALLNDARAAGRRLHEDMPDALRDFRDSVRRLRTTLVVYRAELRGSVRRRDRKALRDVVRRFNPRRDVEAQLEALNLLTPNEASDRVAAHLAEQLATVQGAVGFDWKGFRKVEGRLREKLEIYSQRLDPDNIPVHIAFADVAAQAACRLTTDAMTALGTIQSSSDLDAMRSALMSAKKLRYIIEPLRAISMTAVDAAARLGRLQDLLRAQSDYARLLATIQTISSDAEEPARAALQELADQVSARAAEMYSELHRLWLDDNHKWFFQRIIAAFSAISEPATERSAHRRAFRASESPWRGPSSASVQSS